MKSISSVQSLETCNMMVSVRLVVSNHLDNSAEVSEQSNKQCSQNNKELSSQHIIMSEGTE